MSMTDCGREDLVMTCCSFMMELLNGLRMLMSCSDTNKQHTDIAEYNKLAIISDGHQVPKN